MTVTRSFGTEIDVNTIETGGQGFSSVTALAGGGFVVVWDDGSAEGGDQQSLDVRMQVFDSTGARVGVERIVNSTVAGNQSLPLVTALADGGFAVAWTDASATGADSSGLAVRVRFFDPSGSGRGPDVLVNTSTNGDQTLDSITAFDDGRVAVTFTDAGNHAGDDSGLAVRRAIVDADGTINLGELVLPASTSGDERESSIAALEGGGFVATWTDVVVTSLGTVTSIDGSIFDRFGQRVRGDFDVSTTPATNVGDSTVVALADGGFVVAWSETSTSGPDTSGTTVRGQVFNGVGTRLGDSFVIPTTITDDQTAPELAALADGRFVAVWTDLSETGQDFKFAAIKAQVFNADGTRSGGEMLVNSEIAGAQFDPSVSVLADGRFVVSWTNGPTNSDVRAQIFDPRMAAVNLAGRLTADDLVGTFLADTLSGSFGNDTLRGGNGADRILGDEGNDLLIGGAGVDVLFGGIGNDEMRSERGADRLFGGAGNDAMTVGPDGGLISGGAGVDEVRFTGLTQGVTVSLVAGAVNSRGATGVILQSIENLLGTSRADRLVGNSGANLINADAGNDTIFGAEGDDRLIGRDGADQLFGGLGDDSLTGGNGADLLSGGEGTDTVVYEAAQSIVGVVVNLANPVLNTAEAAGDVFVSIENLSGTGFGDTLSGDSGANLLRGGAGADSLVGSLGADTLSGGTGNDTLTGGGGADLFVFNTALQADNVDRFVGFSVAEDEIALENAVFAGLAVGGLSAAAFVVGAQATATTHRVIYDAVGGGLFFDADGVGGQARVQFATLAPGLALTEANFLVI